MADYNQRMPFDGSSSRRGLWVLAVAMLLFGALALAWRLLQRPLPAPQPASRVPPPAAVGQTTVGTPLLWRELDRQATKDGMVGGLLAGNFDPDPDQELLLLRRHHGYLYEADGSRRSVRLGGLQFLLQAAAWDYDGDGVDEVVADPLLASFGNPLKMLKTRQGTLPDKSPVYALDGRRAAELPGTTAMGLPAFVGDADGDGRSDLVLNDSGIWRIYAPGGGTSTLTPSPGQFSVGFGDLNGDGRAEVLSRENKLKDLLGYGLGGRIVLPPLSHKAMNFTLADITGDGTCEVLSEAQYLDPRTGRT
jgi:hypothetical protein